MHVEKTREDLEMRLDFIRIQPAVLACRLREESSSERKKRRHHNSFVFCYCVVVVTLVFATTQTAPTFAWSLTHIGITYRHRKVYYSWPNNKTKQISFMTADSSSNHDRGNDGSNHESNKHNNATSSLIPSRSLSSSSSVSWVADLNTSQTVAAATDAVYTPILPPISTATDTANYNLFGITSGTSASVDDVDDFLPAPSLSFTSTNRNYTSENRHYHSSFSQKGSSSSLMPPRFGEVGSGRKGTANFTYNNTLKPFIFSASTNNTKSTKVDIGTSKATATIRDGGNTSNRFVSHSVEDFRKKTLIGESLNPSSISLFSSSVSSESSSKEQPTIPPDASSLYSSSILDGVLPVSELFYRSTQSLVDSVNESHLTESTKEGRTSIAFNNRSSLLIADGDSSYQISNRYGDDEELPFSAEQSNQLTSKGVNKINIRRNEADSFTTTATAAFKVSSSETNYNVSNREPSDYKKTPTAVSSASSRNTSNFNGKGGRKAATYGVRAPRYLNTDGNQKYNSSSNNEPSITKSLTTSSRRNNNRKRPSSGKILRRGMEMLVGGEPINADPPLKSIEIRYDSSISDWTQTITTSSRDFGPLLHQSSAALISEVSKGIYCEFFVNSTMKWKICPQNFCDLVQEYEAVASDPAGLVKGKISRGASMFYQDLLGKFKYDENQTSTTKLNDRMAVKDLHQPQQAQNSDFSLRSSSIAVKEEASPNSFSSKLSRGFGERKSSLMRGKNRKNKSNTPSSYKTDVISLEFDLNISRLDLVGDKGSEGDLIFKRILSRGISKAIQAEEMGYIVRIKNLELSQRESGKTNVLVHFVILPEQLRNLNTLQNERSKIDRILSQKGESRLELVISISDAAREESAWSPELKQKFIEELIPAVKMDENSSGDLILERSASLLRKDHITDGELKFELGVSRDDLECNESGGALVLRRVLSNGIERAIRSDGFQVVITKLVLREVDIGVTEISVLFSLASQKKAFSTLQREVSEINHALSEAVDSGDMCRSMAAAARAETAWPDGLRRAIANELLFEAGDTESILDDEEETINAFTEQENSSVAGAPQCEESNQIFSGASTLDFTDLPQKIDGPFVPANFDFDPEDLYLGGGNGGVFYDHSEQNAVNSPYKGKLGPLLMDAATERARQRQPRVIAIGDVHGCLDELQALLRRCDYQPGDLVVFLGDLVSKGPDSLSVVQMAREIGSFGVRGNHDFEVIRWHQAIMSGADPPMIGSEHFHIASCLSKADLKWLYSLPWYLSSKDLGALFVHAGFVPGIRLPKQNPRLMMNMRSILPDGTVTSKFFSNWAWSRLWDGPQTVLFGHDADRGLQQYEHAIGLDTGCVYGGRLTACILPEKRLVSVSAKREYFQYRRKQFD